jgi:hypothetical protein
LVEDALANAPKTDEERFGIREGLVAEQKAKLEQFFRDRVQAAKAETDLEVGRLEDAIEDQAPEQQADDLADSIRSALNDLYDETRDGLLETLKSSTIADVTKAVEKHRAAVAADPLVQLMSSAKDSLGVDARVQDRFDQLFDDVVNRMKAPAPAA